MRIQTDLSQLTIADGTERVRSGAIRPSEWMAACLDIAAGLEPRLKAWAYLNPDQAMRAASARDATDWSAAQIAPALAGVPLAVKDVFNTVDMPCEKGSVLWKDYTPGNDARVVERAKWAGAVVMGKSATAEFAVHSAPDTINPVAPDRIAGTSSTGSAVAVLTGMVPLALGTQSAGSIIRPASYVGVMGFKPSYGLIPRTGVLKTCDTLDTIGWFARSVEDLGLALDTLRVGGRDHPNVERGLSAARAKRAARGHRPWRVAMAIPPSWDQAQPYARDALEHYAHQIGNRRDMDVSVMDLRPDLGDVHAVHTTIYHKNLVYYFKRELDNPELCSESIREVTDDGRSISMEAYRAALDRQSELRDVLARKLDDVDVLITLAVAGEAPGLDHPQEPIDSSLVWTLCGVPSVTVPIFKGPNGLPYGLQIVAPRWGDHTLLEVAKTLYPDVLPCWRPGRADSARHP